MNGTGEGMPRRHEDEGGLDPLRAARLLERARREAQRELDFRSPWLSLVAAAAALLSFGVIWLSVRGQHPYKGPTIEGLLGLYAVVLVRIGTVVVLASPRHGGRQRGLGAPAARGGRGLGGGVACCVRVHGSTGARRGE